MSARSGRVRLARWAVVGAVVAALVGFVIFQRLRPPVTVQGRTGMEEDLEFEVSATECGLPSVSFASGSASARNGTFCIVRPEIRNLEEDTHVLDAECQYLIDRAGNRYSPREDIAALEEASSVLFDQGLGPYEVTPAHVAFYYDVPEQTKPAQVELHASCGSRGLLFEVPA